MDRKELAAAKEALERFAGDSSKPLPEALADRAKEIGASGLARAAADAGIKEVRWALLLLAAVRVFFSLPFWIAVLFMFTPPAAAEGPDAPSYFPSFFFCAVAGLLSFALSPWPESTKAKAWGWGGLVALNFLVTFAYWWLGVQL